MWVGKMDILSVGFAGKTPSSEATLESEDICELRLSRFDTQFTVKMLVFCWLLLFAFLRQRSIT